MCKADKIKNKFPLMWEYAYPSVGGGWLPLLYQLSSYLQHNTDKNNYPQVVVVLCKEKYGGLRFHYYIESHEEDLAPKELLRYDINCSKIEGVISFAESLSYSVCEDCGTFDNVKTEGRWIRSLCSDCRNKTI